MVTQLDVVNECLAIMGEVGLSSLSEYHAFKPAILNKLSSQLALIQSRGWWYNTEELELTADVNDSRVYVPGDTVSVVVLDKRPLLTQRGRVLYDLRAGSDKFPAGTTFKARVMRQLAIEDLPVIAAEHVKIVVLEWFQIEYDGDQTKTRNIQLERTRLETLLMSEHIRNRRVNLFDSSARLTRIRNVLRQVGRY